MKKTLVLILVCMMALFALAACDSNPDTTGGAAKPATGNISGVINDAEGEPLEGAEIYYTEEDYVESDEDGKFSIKNVTVGDLSLTIVLKGYATQTLTLNADSFDGDGNCALTVTMQDGVGTIKGNVSVDGLSSKKLAGVTISLGGVQVKTDENGNYELTDVSMQGTKTLIATIDGYGQSRKTVTVRSFDTNGIATVNFQLVQNDLANLPGVKPSHLEALETIPADKFVLSRNDLQNLNRSPDGLAGTSKVEAHSEGLCLNADTKSENSNMVAFIYGKIKIDDGHKYLTAYARIFFGQNGGSDHDSEAAGNFDGSKLAELGVYLIDEQGNIVTDVAPFQQITTEGYMPVTFDLSAYKGQTVTFLLGTKTGYHCCLDRVEFAGDAPKYLTVNGVDGLTSIMLHDKIADKTFNVDALKEKWSISAGVGYVTEGIQLNGADPWKAEDFTPDDPQGVNSYIYMTTDIASGSSHMAISATLTNLEECKDPASADPNHMFYPWISVIVLDSNGNVLLKTDWTKVEVAQNNAAFDLDYDLSACVGEDVTVVIACNVGYRATITGVNFHAAE